MTAEIHVLKNVTRLDLPVERVIESLGTAGLESVVTIGWKEDGSFYFASSLASGPEVLWLLELAKDRLMVAGDSS